MIEALVDPIGASDMAVLAAGFALALGQFSAGVLVLAERKIRTGETPKV
jgi:hypothetical protein